jgi:transcriptional repressor NrdR
MRCPYCGDEANRVIDSRLGREGSEIRRRRECEECGRRFTTRERVEEIYPKVVKRDERREEYDREKLLAGVQKACQKRPVSADAIERLVDRLEKRLQESGEREVASAWLGERTLEELCALDPIAAARFASVFRGFESAADYAAFFASLADRRPERAPEPAAPASAGRPGGPGRG